METKNELLVEVEGLSKKFCKDLKTSLWYGVQDLFKGWKPGGESVQLRDKEFWALKDINFKLRRGECLGLIGHNGAGKSTLLKILNGLINPDEGKVTMRGKVGALIELGAGFNPILTGRENIYNNGAVLGFSRAEINEKVEEIIDFAEIREFIDMPVQNYSSGMKVRLGFAIAAQTKPDVLIIDEVLAVGDLGFIMKCFKTIDNLLSDTAIIYVSHNMPTISRICTDILLLDHGGEKFFGKDVSEGIDIYYSSFSNNQVGVIFTDKSVELISAKILHNGEKSDFAILKWGEDLCLIFSFLINKQMEVPLFRILIYDKEQRPVAILDPNKFSDSLKIKGDKLIFNVKHSNLQLSKGLYSINLTVFSSNSNNPLLRVNDIISFQISHQEDHFQPFLLESKFDSYDFT